MTFDDVMRALVRLDRLEMRLGTSAQNGKTVPIFNTDLEAEARQSLRVPGFGYTGTRYWVHCKRT